MTILQTMVPEATKAVRQACIGQVSRIVDLCRRNNEKFTDQAFDIVGDGHLVDEKRDTLHGLPTPDNSSWGQTSNNGDGWSKQLEKAETAGGATTHQQSVPDHKLRFSHKSRDNPGSARRLTDIFDQPLFAQNAPKSSLKPIFRPATSTGELLLQRSTMALDDCHWYLLFRAILLRVAGFLSLMAFLSTTSLLFVLRIIFR
ncbi:hypothetical protein DOTSEDRAFT_72352, partial [Dothistroma septosporum NZE10]